MTAHQVLERSHRVVAVASQVLAVEENDERPVSSHDHRRAPACLVFPSDLPRHFSQPPVVSQHLGVFEGEGKRQAASADPTDGAVAPDWLSLCVALLFCLNCALWLMGWAVPELPV